MKGLRYYLLLSGLSVAMSCPTQGLLAANSDKVQAPDSKTKINELSPRQERGASFTEILAPTSISRPAIPIAPPATKPLFSPVPSVKHALNQKHPAHKSPVTAIKPQGHTSKPTPHGQPVSPPSDNSTTAIAPAQPAEQAPTANPVTSEIVTVSHAVVSPNPVSAAISAWLDKPGATPRYRVGDKMVVNVTAATDCNVVIFNYDAKGTLTQIFPNDMQTVSFVKAGESVQIGGQDSPFDYEVSGKGGLERIFVYAYPTSSEQPITVAMTPVPHSPFRSAEMSIERYRELVNSSKVFFSREVKIVPKTGARLTSTSSPSPASPPQPNKVELTFQVESR